MSERDENQEENLSLASSFDYMNIFNHAWNYVWIFQELLRVWKLRWIYAYFLWKKKENLLTSSLSLNLERMGKCGGVVRADSRLWFMAHYLTCVFIAFHIYDYFLIRIFMLEFISFMNVNYLNFARKWILKFKANSYKIINFSKTLPPTSAINFPRCGNCGGVRKISAKSSQKYWIHQTRTLHNFWWRWN